jgi:hypothetical protein
MNRQTFVAIGAGLAGASAVSQLRMQQLVDAGRMVDPDRRADPDVPLGAAAADPPPDRAIPSAPSGVVR